MRADMHLHNIHPEFGGYFNNAVQALHYYEFVKRNPDQNLIWL